MQRLPNEILPRILQYFDLRTLYLLRRVCKKWDNCVLYLDNELVSVPERKNVLLLSLQPDLQKLSIPLSHYIIWRTNDKDFFKKKGIILARICVQDDRLHLIFRCTSFYERIDLVDDRYDFFTILTSRTFRRLGTVVPVKDEFFMSDVVNFIKRSRKVIFHQCMCPTRGFVKEKEKCSDCNSIMCVNCSMNMANMKCPIFECGECCQSFVCKVHSSSSRKNKSY